MVKQLFLSIKVYIILHKAYIYKDVHVPFYDVCFRSLIDKDATRLSSEK